MGRSFNRWSTPGFCCYLDGITNGRLVLVAVGDEAGITQWGDFRCTKLPYAWVDGVIGKLQSLGSTNIAHYCYNDSWAILARADGSLTTEDLIAQLSREWDRDPAMTARLALPILNELLRMKAITVY